MNDRLVEYGLSYNVRLEFLAEYFRLSERTIQRHLSEKDTISKVEIKYKEMHLNSCEWFQKYIAKQVKIKTKINTPHKQLKLEV